MVRFVDIYISVTNYITMCGSYRLQKTIHHGVLLLLFSGFSGEFGIGRMEMAGPGFIFKLQGIAQDINFNFFEVFFFSVLGLRSAHLCGIFGPCVGVIA